MNACAKGARRCAKRRNALREGCAKVREATQNLVREVLRRVRETPTPYGGVVGQHTLRGFLVECGS